MSGLLSLFLKLEIIFFGLDLGPRVGRCWWC